MGHTAYLLGFIGYLRSISKGPLAPILLSMPVMTIRNGLLSLAVIIGMTSPSYGQSMVARTPLWTEMVTATMASNKLKVISVSPATNAVPVEMVRPLQEAAVVNTGGAGTAAASNYGTETGINTYSNQTDTAYTAPQKTYSYEAGDACENFKDQEPYYSCCQAYLGPSLRKSLALDALFGNPKDLFQCCVERNLAKDTESNEASFTSDFRQECPCQANPLLTSCQSCIPDEWTQYQAKAAQENDSAVKVMTEKSGKEVSSYYYAVATEEGVQKAPLPPACPKICDNPPPIVDSTVPYDPYDQFWLAKVAWVHPAQLNENWSKDPSANTATTHLKGVTAEICAKLGGTTPNEEAKQADTTQWATRGTVASEAAVEQMAVATNIPADSKPLERQTITYNSLYDLSKAKKYESNLSFKYVNLQTVDCLLTKPILSCEKPADPPLVITQEIPEAPVIIPPESPQLKASSFPFCFCIEDDLEAVCGGEGKRIPLSTPCRRLSRSEVLDPKMSALAIEAIGYMNNPKVETLKEKLAPKLAENFNLWLAGDTARTFYALRVETEGDDTVGEVGSIVDQQTVINNIKNNYKITQEGLIPVNPIETPIIFTTNSVQYGNAGGDGVAQPSPPTPPNGNGGGGPQGPNGPPSGVGGSGVAEVGEGIEIQESEEKIKKKIKEETVSLEALAITMETGNLVNDIPNEFLLHSVAFAELEGGGCTLSTGPTQRGSVWTILFPILMMAAWRFRPQRRRALVRSSINTPKREPSTKN